jgi:hypothetical protein
MLDLSRNIRKFNTYAQSGGIEPKVIAFWIRFRYTLTSDIFVPYNRDQKTFYK